MAQDPSAPSTAGGQPVIIILRMPNGQHAVQYLIPPRAALRQLLLAIEDVRDAIHPPPEPSMIVKPRIGGG